MQNIDTAQTQQNATTPRNFDIYNSPRRPIRAWTRGVPVEAAALEQLQRVAALPFVHSAVAVMPDVHVGKGATIGSVIPTTSAIIPAAVGVDLGCGMMAVRTSLTASDLPDNLAALRSGIEKSVPHGRTGRGRRGDRGAWGNVPDHVGKVWQGMKAQFDSICDRHPALRQSNHAVHLGTLGTGNHFIELCLDEADQVWVMLHSGSRGVGNRIGSYFIRKAKEEMKRWHIHLPDQDLAYLPEGSTYFGDYVEAVGWAQNFAAENRKLMMQASLRALRDSGLLPEFTAGEGPSDIAVNCHHNYIAKEEHGGKKVWITRKGAVRAGLGELGIIPGSMGTRSFIVRGKGSEDSFCSCSHGAGRVMSRTAARKAFSVEDHAAATAGVECRKDASVIDETPAAYKDIDAVMAAQADLVEVVHTLNQVVCVKG